MFLNEIQPAPGAKKAKKRVGRGIGSGIGKTCGRGHKGQKSRSGGFHKLGFEGGQQPLQRRLPKFGFTSLKSLVTQEIRLSELAKVDGDSVTLASLKKSGLLQKNIKFVKVILSGELKKAVKVSGDNIRVTKGAKAAIEAAGGTIEA